MLSRAHALLQEAAALLAVERPALLAQLIPVMSAIAPCRHSEGFTSVYWHGATYSFSPAQAAVVRQLWRSWEAGTPDLNGDALLVEAGCESGKMSDLFKRHPAWGAMIVEGQVRGLYRLAEPSA